MKKLVLYTTIMLLLTSCFPNSVYNYKGGVIVAKNNLKVTGLYYLSIRHTVESKDYIYVIDNIRVTEYEYNQFNLGDTIK